MKNNKFIPLLLFFCFSLSILGSRVSYAATKNQEYAGNQLKLLGILTGYDDGSLGLDQSVTRAEMATIMVRTLGLASKEGSNPDKEFNDVDKSNWAHTYVKAAYRHGIVSGYKDNTYRPKNNISFQEVITMLVRAHGTEPEEDTSWPDNYLNPAKKIKLLKEDVDGTHIATRGEVAEYLWRVMLLK